MQKQNTISITLLGDVSLNGHWSSAENDPFGKKISSMIVRHDVVLLNLESTVKGDHGENELKKPRLQTTESSVLGLKTLNPTVCVLGNNHCYDNLDDGLLKTVRAVEQIGSHITGIRSQNSKSPQPAVFQSGGIEFAVLSYVAEDTHPNLPFGCDCRLNDLEIPSIITDVAAEKKQGRFVIVSLHWGREFEKYPTPDQRLTAQKIVEAGADLIWGHHAHTCQGWEIFNDRLIFYSIGNTVFDDLPGIAWDADSRRSLLVSLEIDSSTLSIPKESIRVSLLERPTSVSQPELIESPNLVQNLCWPLGWKYYQIFWYAYQAWLFQKRIYQYFGSQDRKPYLQALKLPIQILRKLRVILSAQK